MTTESVFDHHTSTIATTTPGTTTTATTPTTPPFPTLYYDYCNYYSTSYDCTQQTPFTSEL
eukprot:m.275668 g.275668  ORF g.275668 m.275668 type:complete len:61 (-) comp76642_c0_seq1:393-575(-)